MYMQYLMRPDSLGSLVIYYMCSNYQRSSAVVNNYTILHAPVSTNHDQISRANTSSISASDIIARACTPVMIRAYEREL